MNLRVSKYGTPEPPPSPHSIVVESSCRIFQLFATKAAWTTTIFLDEIFLSSIFLLQTITFTILCAFILPDSYHLLASHHKCQQFVSQTTTQQLQCYSPGQQQLLYATKTKANSNIWWWLILQLLGDGFIIPQT